jgi:hypothetical protein
MSRRAYEKQKYRLQVELLKLQAWVKETGAAGGDPLRRAATPPARAAPSSG